MMMAVEHKTSLGMITGPSGTGKTLVTQLLLQQLDSEKNQAVLVLVTPGIRPAGTAAGDQKRVMTPAAAIRAGADYLVVGRPIVAAPDPKAAADAIVADIAAAHHN